MVIPFQTKVPPTMSKEMEGIAKQASSAHTSVILLTQAKDIVVNQGQS